MKKLHLLLGLAAAVAVAPQAASAQYTFAGSWFVGQGPQWATDPPPLVYSAVEAAALLFGGSASDYVISTIDNDPTHINFKAFVDGWGDHDYSPLVDQAFSHSPQADNRYWCSTTAGPGHTDTDCDSSSPNFDPGVLGVRE